MFHTLKYHGVANILLLAFSSVFVEACLACGPFIPDKQLSFFSTQFISDPTLRQYIRSGGASSVAQEMPLVEKYRENLIDWQQYFERRGAHISLEQLAYVVYELDEPILAHMLSILSLGWEFFDAPTAAQKWTTLLSLHDFFQCHNLKSLKTALANPAPEIRWNASQTFLFFQTLSRKDFHDIGNYLLFAKQCEMNSSAYAGHCTWEEEVPVSFRKSGGRELLEIGKQKYQTCDSEWLKMRYAYQLIRLAHYMGEFDESIRLYDELAAPLNVKNVGTYLAMEQTAGALHGLRREAQSLYWFARVFGKLSSRKERIYRSIDMISPNEQEWRESLQFASSQHEKMSIWTLWTIYHERRQSVRPLRSLYELDPQAALLEDLLLWHVLKFEQKGFMPFFLRGKFEQIDSAYLQEFKRFVLEVLRDGKIRRPAIWYAAAGYLAFMETFLQENYIEAQGYLEHAEAEALDEPDFVHQARLLRHLLTLYQSPPLDQGFYSAIYPELQWLIARKETTLFRTVMTTLAQKFLLQNDVPRAACCLFEAHNNISINDIDWSSYQRAVANSVLDVYANSSDIEALYKFLNQSSYSLFDFLLIQHFPLSHEQVLDLWGTHVLRDRHFERAAKIFERIPSDYWISPDYCNEWDMQSLCRTQFTTSFWDNPHHTAQKFVNTNKLAFTRAVIELLSQAKRDKMNADRYYWQIANAFYNTPYWGYVGSMWRGSLIWSLRYEYHATSYPFTLPKLSQQMVKRERDFLNIYGTRLYAREYYEKVVEHTKDDELAAESLELAQRCSIKTFGPLHGYGKYDYGSQQKLPPVERDYFHELHEAYAHTAFHHHLLEECPSFKDYVRQNF